jgi:AcrR family transcriptional regulator
MPRAGLSEDAVVRLALALVDEGGVAALTLSDVAARAGVATPSLYRHVRSRSQLHSLVAAHVLGEMTEFATSAVLGRGGDDAVAALMRRLRAYAMEHPARFAAVPSDPLHDPALAEPAARFLEVFYAVLRGYDLEGSAAVHATRCLRVIVFGFSVIEAGGGFGLDEDPAQTYEDLIEMYLSYLHRHHSGRNQ